MKWMASIFLSFLFFLSAFAQNGKLSGRIVDQKNSPVVGATIEVANANVRAISDVDGRFNLSLAPGTKYSITVSAVGYTSKTIDEVEISAGKVEDIQIVLSVNAANLQSVTIRTTVRRESTNALIQYQKNTSAVAQVISAEAIRRSPDKNTGEALKRVTGLSIQEGRYLVVRGLSDRYNQAMLNGILLSSTEPDRKTFSFDIFPAPVIENIIVNKTFIPEYSAEWAGGLVQVNTRDIPSKGFLNVQIGTNFNTNTVGKDFYTYPGGSLDWLGFDDGKRGLPDGFPTKSKFEALSDPEKTELGKDLIANKWSVNKKSNLLSTLGQSFQINGGFNTKVFDKEFGGVITATYNRSVKLLDYNNGFFSFEDVTKEAHPTFRYNNMKYTEDVLWGAMANFSVKLNSNNKITVKNLLNVHSLDNTTLRTGKDYEANSLLGENIQARELNFTANTFFNTTLSGEHNIPSLKTKFNWFGSFNILDQYIPMQRRMQYNQDPSDPGAPYLALLSNTLSQKSGSIFYSSLSDYIYTAGGDLTYSYNLFGHKQSVKGGYLFQVKDRLYDAKPFSVHLPIDNPTLKAMDIDHIFSPENFGPADNQLQFDALFGNQYRYLANSILNAGYLQSDNAITDWLRIVWGARYEYYDQLIGSTRKSDSRFLNTKKGDLLPAVNITFKTNEKTNIRAAGSQTLIRPEFRELSDFAFYDFEVGATFTGKKELVRTKVTNLDLRYEIYPRNGELITVGAFYKYFDAPIELLLNQSGAGSSNTFNYVNANSAYSVGFEFEFRKRLDFISDGLKHFTAQGNYSYIYNRVKFDYKKLDRPMQGQSPYVINAGLLYDPEKGGWSATALFNMVGRRILYVGNENVVAIWEAPRPLLDLQIAKKIIQNKGELRLSIADLLNQPANFYYDLDDNKKFNSNADALALRRKYGTNVSLTFNYTIK